MRTHNHTYTPQNTIRGMHRIQLIKLHLYVHNKCSSSITMYMGVSFLVHVCILYVFLLCCAFVVVCVLTMSTSVFVWGSVCGCVDVHLCVCMRPCVCMHPCVSVCLCVCACVWVYVCTQLIVVLCLTLTFDSFGSY